MGYRQLTQTQRYQIHARFDLGMSRRQIATALGIRVGIEHRPAEVADRRFIGHWEGDTVIQGYKQSGLVTLVERRSGYLLAARLPRISAELTKAAMIRLLKPRRGGSPDHHAGQWLGIRRAPGRVQGGDSGDVLL